jgi:aspartyl-tRNA(Asn)/glutamyl-tRNA(Gln) amidotransferase subunit A
MTDCERTHERFNIFIDRAPDARGGAAGGPNVPALPLQDWTLAVKSNIAVQGLPHTAGLGAYRHRVAARDAFVVARLREAGMNVLGTVNMEEAALGAVTDNPHFGRTYNPRRDGFTPGGSSGGSAAAVAAGLARVALGTDTMGSCRIPAAYCGVVGFKPSYGMISLAGVEPLCHRLDHVGILAHTVEDVTAVFRAARGFDPIDPASALPAPRTAGLPVEGAAERDAGVAVLDAASRAGLSEPVHRAYARAVERLAARIAIAERRVDVAALADTRRAALLVCEAELAVTLATPLARDDGGISPALRSLIAFAQRQSAPRLAAAHLKIDAAELILREALGGSHALFWPTAPQPAFAFGTPVPADQADFTCLANFTGAPAVSLPLAVGDGELPVGGQFIAARGQDNTLLDLAQSFAPLIA